MSIRRGWHTYWKNPGDSGLPPTISWTLPAGVSAGPIEWPSPERVAENALVSYGYRDEVLLPIEITTPAGLAGDSLILVGAFKWLECADVCVPGSSELRLSLPVRPGAPAPSGDAPRFTRARGRTPDAPTGWVFRAEAGPRAVSLRFRQPPGSSVRGAYFFVDRPLVLDYAAPQGFEREADGYRLTATPAANAQGLPDHLTGVLVVEGRSESGSPTAVWVDVPVTHGDPAPAPVPSAKSFSPSAWRLVLFVVAGLGLTILLARSIPRRKSS
jgi:thiol:disulfide interchange protein DsbD